MCNELIRHTSTNCKWTIICRQQRLFFLTITFERIDLKAIIMMITSHGVRSLKKKTQQLHQESCNLTGVKVHCQHCIAIGLIYGTGAVTAKLKPIDSISNNGICGIRISGARRYAEIIGRFELAYKGEASANSAD